MRLAEWAAYSKLECYTKSWWTGRPGMLRFMGSQRVRRDWATDLIWSDLILKGVELKGAAATQLKQIVATWEITQGSHIHSSLSLSPLFSSSHLPPQTHTHTRIHIVGCPSEESQSYKEPGQTIYKIIFYNICIESDFKVILYEEIVLFIYYKLESSWKYQVQDMQLQSAAAAAAAKWLQSCPTLCNPIDGSPPGSPVPGILQARTLEWVAISLSNALKWKVKMKSLSHAQLLATPWTAAYQTPPSMRFSSQEYWSGVPLPSPKNKE